MNIHPEFDILEVTLRDGSYLIDFQFTQEDTINIAGGLENAGFKWIEIGHGLGLNATNSKKGIAAASDEEYLETASSILHKSNWGMFFIPGIGRIEDLIMARRYGMKFIRIGTNINEVPQAQIYIEKAKELGYFVCYNAMKSYAVTPTEFAKNIKLTEAWGIDMAYLVDSAGGMYPSDIENYFKAIQSISNISLGFHGHDNLSLAMANTLKAIECGAKMVDTSLQGMGRSAGNAITEVLLSIIQQKKRLLNIDLKAVMDLGHGIINPLLKINRMNPMAITSGYARFHSSFTPKVKDFAKKYNLDVRDVIVRLCEEDLINAPDELLEKISKELASENTPRLFSIPVKNIISDSQISNKEKLTCLVKDIIPLSIKTNKYSAINVVFSETFKENYTVSKNIYSSQNHVIGSVSISGKNHLTEVLKVIDGQIDVVLLDTDPKPFIDFDIESVSSDLIEKSKLFTYLDSRVWIEAVASQVISYLNNKISTKNIIILGNHEKTRLLSLNLRERCSTITIIDNVDIESYPKISIARFSFDPNIEGVNLFAVQSNQAINSIKNADILIVWPANKAWFSDAYSPYIKKEAIVFDASIGSILQNAVLELRIRDIQIIRVNIWPLLASYLMSLQEYSNVFENDFGRKEINGISVVAGGFIGNKNDIVVDSITNLTRIIGIADGVGGVNYNFNEQDLEKISKIRMEIKKLQIISKIED